MAWLIDSLLYPEDPSVFKPLAAGKPMDLGSFSTRLRDSKNVALHLLLSSSARGFLTAICRRLTNLDYTARKAMSTAAQSQGTGSVHISQPLTSNTLRTAYTTIATLTSTSVIHFRIFEAFLGSISASVKDAYTTARYPPTTSQTQQQQQQQPRTKTEGTRNDIELTILFGGPLPVALEPVMRKIFTSFLPTLRSGIDPAKLFFNDYSLLALDPPTPSSVISPPTPADHSLASLLGSDQQQQRGKEGAGNERITHTIDIFQRVPIELGQEPVDSPANENGVKEKARNSRRWRRCVRCTAVMEDIVTQKPAVHFMILHQRRCFCGGGWYLMSGKQIVI